MTIFIAILALIFLIVIHELGHMLTAKSLGVRVPEFGVGFGPPLFRKKFGKTHYSFRIILLGGFAKIAGMGDGEEGEDTYYAKPVWRRALIIFAGPAVNLVFALLMLSALQAVQGVPTQVEPEVSAVQPGTMAAEVGLEPGDDILAVDGQRTQSWEGLNEVVDSRSVGEEVTVTYQRGGEENTVAGELGAVSEASSDPLIGIQPTITEVSHSPFLALWEGSQQTVNFVGTYMNGLYQLVTGQLAFFDNVSGPVGITAVGSQVISAGVLNALTLLAIISLILGIMNLLPILPLDGGHLLMLAAEKVTGSPVSEQTMMRIAAFGLAMILTLFFFATYADISRIVSGEPFIPR